ncbi:hypothetical protein C8R43DRAFT_1001464 [Mycena crocata]|nr:hypothetical protein C8R43DRAFT_1001464 [Mycena crocata]
MKFLASCTTTVGPLAALAPILLLSFAPVSALTFVPRGDLSGNLNASSILAGLNASQTPPECTSACQPIFAARSTCGIDLNCLCTDTNGNNFAQCSDCVVAAAPNATAIAQLKFLAGTELDAYTTSCADNKHPIASLSLSISPSATSSSGTAASGPDASSTGTVTQTQENTAVSFVYSTMPVIAVLQFFFISVGLLVSGVVLSE